MKIKTFNGTNHLVTREVNKFLENPKIEVKGLRYSTTTVHRVGGKAFNGDDLPKRNDFFSDETKQKQVNAWRVVADVAILELS